MARHHCSLKCSHRARGKAACLSWLSPQRVSALAQGRDAWSVQILQELDEEPTYR